MKNQRLDVFFQDFFNDPVVFLCRLVLSHRQNQVERDFSINTEILNQNTKEEAIVSLQGLF